MTPQEAIEILTKHNAWRRWDKGGEVVPPAMIGDAIDCAIHIMKMVNDHTDYKLISKHATDEMAIAGYVECEKLCAILCAQHVWDAMYDNAPKLDLESLG